LTRKEEKAQGKKKKKKNKRSDGVFNLFSNLHGIIQRPFTDISVPSAQQSWKPRIIGTNLPNRQTRGLLPQSLGFSMLCQAAQWPLQAQGDAHNPIDMHGHGMAWHRRSARCQMVILSWLPRWRVSGSTIFEDRILAIPNGIGHHCCSRPLRGDYHARIPFSCIFRIFRLFSPSSRKRRASSDTTEMWARISPEDTA
jgi:hypothetical protein